MSQSNDNQTELVLSNSAVCSSAGYRIVDPLYGSASGESQGLREYGRMISRHKVAITASAILFAGLGALISVPQSPIYRARTAIEVEGPESSSHLRDFDSTTNTNNASLQPNTEAQARTLRDAGLVERTLLDLSLDKRPASVITPGKLPLLFGRRAPAYRSQDELVRAAMNHLIVEVSAEHPIIDVSFDSTDPRVASDFLNKLVENLNIQNLESRRKSAQQLHIWLTGELQSQKAVLERSSDALQAYARSNGLVNGETGAHLPEERLRQLQDELSRAHADRITKQARYEQSLSSPMNVLPEILDSQVLRDYGMKLADLRRQLAESNVTFQPTYPKVAGLQAQVAELEATMRSETANILRRLDGEYRAAVRHEDLLTRNYAEQAKVVSDQALVDARYGLLKREVDANRNLYDTMLQKVKVASVISAMQASNIRVISPARPPSEPYTPRPMFNTLMGFVAGSFLSMGFVFVREQTDRSLRRPGDAARYLCVPELGLIPSVARGHGIAERRSYSAPDSVGPASGMRASYLVQRLGFRMASQKSAKDKVALATWYDHSSSVAEAMRIVISSLWLGRAGSARPRVVVLASARSGDGKTTLASNIAIALAESCRVLLIDGDLRKPSLHRIFGVSNATGLGEILSSTAELPANGEDLACKTTIPQLWLLPSGSTSVKVGSLRYYQRLERLLRHFRNTFDAVLIDTPPVLGIADARIFGRLSDVVVFVLRAAATTRDEASAALSNFQDDGTPVIGTVLNHWNPKHFSYGDVGCCYYHKHLHTGF